MVKKNLPDNQDDNAAKTDEIVRKDSTSTPTPKVEKKSMLKKPKVKKTADTNEVSDKKETKKKLSPQKSSQSVDEIQSSIETVAEASDEKPKTSPKKKVTTPEENNEEVKVVVTKKTSKKSSPNESKIVTPASAVNESATVEVVQTISMGNKDATFEGDITIEKKLESLFKLQVIDSKIDEIRIVRGELPLEVQDLEDEVAGLETRIENYKKGIKEANDMISSQKVKISDSQNLMKKYEDQKMNVRNNREYDSLNKEVEFQGLEIQLSEKKINESLATIEHLKSNIEVSTQELTDKKDNLSVKKNELDGIIVETENEEKKLVEKSKECQKFIEPRLLAAYERIRKSVRNGLAVVQIERDACAGCFNTIPPQRQLDIKMHRKIIVCEFCGRILVDDDIANKVREELK